MKQKDIHYFHDHKFFLVNIPTWRLSRQLCDCLIVCVQDPPIVAFKVHPFLALK